MFGIKKPAADDIDTDEAISDDIVDSSAPDEIDLSLPVTENGTDEGSPEESAPEEITDSAPEKSEEPIASAPEIAEEPVMTKGACLSDAAKLFFSNDMFHDFVAVTILQFLSLVDIADPGQRRGAIIALKLGEDGLHARFRLASSFLHLQEMYGLSIGQPQLVNDSKLYMTKLSEMKAWLGI